MKFLNFRENKNTSGIIAALCCVAATGIGFGLSLPLLSIIMKNMGYSSSIIGLNTAMPALAAMLLSPLFVKYLEKYGLKVFIFFCVVVSLLSFISFYFTQVLLFWFLLRFIFGACLDAIFVASETWIAELSNDQIRGRIMGIFSSCLSIGYFTGAGILTITGSQGLTPFIVGSFFLALVLVPLFIAKNKIPNITSEEKTPLIPIILSTPVAMFAAVVYGYLETSAFNLLPIFGEKNGLTERVSVSLLISVGLGQACLQYFIGAIADKYGSLKSLLVCVILGVLGAIGIKIFILQPIVLYVILFFWGACISGFYTLALIIVGNKYQGSSLAGGNSAIVAMFGLGSLIGPPIVGVSMLYSDSNGFFLAILFPVAVYGIELSRSIFMKKRLS
ncbi:MFS transporter [Pigmentibacter sp. JX0631]|uniref:MFS transporter n=1 Tax=Pigmentibacter sp. JX0631 TaxID=2976982 RepID=UPI00246826A6|nr:MFS transporter [Pigmentibacter sp. JX0631]WGL61007.1 MFS transporter [Pigmentibacter sp. JX0631]